MRAASCRAAAVGLSSVQRKPLERTASGPADEDCAADIAASFGSLVVSGGAVHVVCELGTLVRHREKWRKVRRVEYGALLWAGPLCRGGAESYRRDTGGTADDDSENQYGQSPMKRRSSSHVALLCSLLRQQ